MGRTPYGVGKIRGWPGKAGVLLAAWLAAMLIALAPGAWAQEIKLPGGDQPVSLVADTISVNSETRTIVAEGSVEVYYGERTLTADRIVYNDETGRIFAEGSLVLRDPSGVTVFADAAELDADLIDGLVKGARSVMGEHTRLAAVEARRVNERYNTLSKAVYSPCKVCADDPTPLWRIRARKVIHDEKERVIHYENATFDVLGVPIAWLPYFRHPDPTVKRMSGFLVPSFFSSSIFGYGVKQPYFLVIDDYSDLTVTPFFMTNDGLIMELEYRRAFADGDLRVSGSGTVNDYLGNTRFHGHFDSEGRFNLTDEIEWGWDITVTSDDSYLSRFDYAYGDRLSSEIFLRRYRRDGFFDVSGVYFQSLRDNEPSGDIPRALPVIEARYNFDEDLLGGRVGLIASSYTLFRNRGRDVTRMSLGADWEKQVITDWGLSLTAFAEARGDVFFVNNDPTFGSDTIARFTGLVGFEAAFPLVTDTTNGVTHVIEPVVQAILAPYGGNDPDIPVEDSLVTEFDETNVIDRNHFSGLDSVEEGPRVNMLVRYERLSGDGLRFDAALGRVFRFKSQQAFSIGSGLQAADSDFVAAWSAGYDPYFQVRHRMRFDDDGRITRNELFGEVDYGRFEMTVGYVFFEADPTIGTATDREEVNGTMRLGIDENWSLTAFAQRNLDAGEFVQFGGGISYENECCAVDLVVKRQATDSENDPASTSVNLQIRLFTLGAGNDR